MLISGSTGTARMQSPAPSETWRFDRLDRVGGHETTVLGNPRVVDSPLGPVVEFDGEDDALLLPVHPLAGATTFTWEAIFRPDGGRREQRWFHLQEEGSENRMLFEIRVAGQEWFLDSFAFSATGEKALINRDSRYPVGAWYHVASVYDGRVFSNYVNGVRQGSFDIALTPQGRGRTSVGVRITLVDYFKGAIHSSRFTRRALAPAEFLPRPAATAR
jgi:hypothetical protein